MKQAVRTMIAAGFLVTGLVACKSKIQETAQSPAPQPQTSAAAPVTPAPETATPAPADRPSAKYFTGKVLETMNAGGYTYVHVDNGTNQIWAAAPQFEAKVGEKVNVPEGMPMKDYESKTLNRKFDVVYFVGAIGKGDQPPAQTAAPAGEPTQLPEGAHPKLDPAQAAKDAKVTFTGIKKADKTVADIYAGQASLGGKEVSVRGKVVKFSPQIMGKNWVHVQDGTGQAGSNDLTVTTADAAKAGDTVLVTGKITLKKDFGMGYKYDLIIEDGKVKVE
ncbi:MAG: nucleotide-binding protein [Candidatus Methylomirabilia bacterium]